MREFLRSGGGLVVLVLMLWALLYLLLWSERVIMRHG
jgi:hypothetical protein